MRITAMIIYSYHVTRFIIGMFSQGVGLSPDEAFFRGNADNNQDRKRVVGPAKNWEGGHGGDINESLYACVGFLLQPLRTYWRQFWWRLSWLMIVKSLIKSFIMISQPIYSEIDRRRDIFLCRDEVLHCIRELRHQLCVDLWWCVK